MRILLIDPPFHRFTGFVNFYFPVGLALVAAALRDAGHDVAIFDSDAVRKGENLAGYEYQRLERYRKGLNHPSHPAWQELVEVTRRFQPDLVGITAITTKMGSVLKTAAILKEHFPHLPIAAGGPHPTLLPEQIMQCREIDIAVVGEGERTMVSVAHALETLGSLHSVQGILFREGETVLRNPPREFIADLDEIPFPARERLMDPGGYTSADMGAINTTRGCPFRCSYCCHLWTRKVRVRSIDHVMAEIKEVMAVYGTKQFDFKDDTFTLDRKRTIRLCNRIISERLNISWSCSTRVNLLDEE
ncbi:MAG: radical SAM protein, partial [Planctomycetota bacterium]